MEIIAFKLGFSVRFLHFLMISGTFYWSLDKEIYWFLFGEGGFWLIFDKFCEFPVDECLEWGEAIEKKLFKQIQAHCELEKDKLMCELFILQS